MVKALKTSPLANRPFLNSPLEINTLLEIYCSGSVSGKSPAHKEAIDKFIQDKIIYQIKDSRAFANFKLTEKGKFFVAMVLNTHYPTERIIWIDPREI